VVFTIAEDALGQVMEQLRNGATLTVDVYDRAAQKKLASGALIAVDNQIDTTTGTVKVRASFANDDFALFPNQFVNARLLVKTLQDATLIPSSSIQQNGQTSFVYVIEDNVAHLKNIKPGVSDNGLTQVDGINPGDVLADSSFDKLQDNSKVTVSTGQPSATQTPGGQPKHGNQPKQGNEKPGSEQQQAGNKGT
jgi:multidrug efflux system membrane fusion protein